jgi:hypothetical protein
MSSLQNKRFLLACLSLKSWHHFVQTTKQTTPMIAFMSLICAGLLYHGISDFFQD